MSQSLTISGQPISFEVHERKRQQVRFTYNGKAYHFTGYHLGDGSFVLEQEMQPGVWRRISGYAGAAGKGGIIMQLGMLEALMGEEQAQTGGQSSQARLSPLAPMPGMVRQVLVSKGDRVKEGQALAVIEAMKLQLTLSAGGEASVDAILIREGQMVAEGAELFTLTAITE